MTWTRDETIERRAAWNAAVRAGEATGANGKVDLGRLAAMQARLGFTADQLKAAVYDHDLDGERAAYEARLDVQRERLVDAVANAIERGDRAFARMHAAQDALAWHQRERNEQAVATARAARAAFDAEHPEILGAMRAAREAELARAKANPNWGWD